MLTKKYHCANMVSRNFEGEMVCQFLLQHLHIITFTLLALKVRVICAATKIKH